jgi:hypothetical protein
MQAIRAHFDGSAIVPDEPVALAANTKLIILVDSGDSSGMDELNRAAREYYQSLTAEEIAEDAEWARAAAPDSKHAWDGE